MAMPGQALAYKTGALKLRELRARYQKQLGKKFNLVGLRPLVIGYACATLGLLVYSFTWSYLQFDDRIAKGLLGQNERWSVVTGWTIYLAVLNLIFVLPGLGLILVPVSAALLKFQKLDLRRLVVVIVAVWLAVVLITWSSPSNQWHIEHRLESLQWALVEFISPIMLIALPFMLGIWGSYNRKAFMQNEDA